MRPEEAAAVFSSFLNGASQDDLTAFAELVTNDHRTLQQVAFSTLLKCIERWADGNTKGQYDDRNAATVKACRQIVDHFSTTIHDTEDLFNNGVAMRMPFI